MVTSQWGEKVNEDDKQMESRRVSGEVSFPSPGTPPDNDHRFSRTHKPLNSASW
ncbi:hypothetical protein BaRGS_00037062, partial [Batillaria attramentaria]